MDFYAIVLACAHYYKTEAEKQAIFEAVDRLAQKARDICFG